MNFTSPLIPFLMQRRVHDLLPLSKYSIVRTIFRLRNHIQFYQTTWDSPMKNYLRLKSSHHSIFSSSSPQGKLIVLINPLILERWIRDKGVQKDIYFDAISSSTRMIIRVEVGEKVKDKRKLCYALARFAKSRWRKAEEIRDRQKKKNIMIAVITFDSCSLSRHRQLSTFLH